VKKWGNLALIRGLSSVATAVAPTARGAAKVCVLGVQRSTAVRAFVKGCEPVQAVNSRCERLFALVGSGLRHPPIVDASRRSRSDADSVELWFPVGNGLHPPLGARSSEEFRDEARLEGDVAIHVPTRSLNIRPFEGGVRIFRFGIVAKGLAQKPMVTVSPVVLHDEIEVVSNQRQVRRRRKGLAAGHVEVADPGVAGRFDERDGRSNHLLGRNNDIDVDDRFRRETGHRRRTDVFDS
jgi:hypothetical protein